MIALKGYNEVQALQAGEFAKLPAGGYVCITKTAETSMSKENKPMLTLTFDIAEGNYKGTFKNAQYPPKLYQPIYKDDKISPYFKGMLNNYEASNSALVINGDYFDEKQLVNKFIGVVFGEEEREWQGKIYTDTKPKFTTTVAKIRADDFKIPELKKVDKHPDTSATTLNETSFDDDFSGTEIKDENVPF